MLEMNRSGKRLGAVLCVLMLAGLTACGEDTKVIESAGTSQVQTQVIGGADGATEIKLEDENGGWAFQTGEAVITPDMDAASIVDLLGEPKSYFEAASCAFEGLDKIYTYTSFEIETYPQGEVDRIKSIVLKDDTVSTAEGISIGDGGEKVREIYGTPTEEDTGKLVYQKDQMKLVFVVNNGAVASIEYDSMVME